LETASTNLRAITLDIIAAARKRSTGREAHPLLPPPVLAMTRQWLALGGKRPPAWSAFEMRDVQLVMPYLSVLRCHHDNSFSFTFMGASVSAVLGEDLTGCVVTARDAVWAEIDWYRRCKPVADIADIQLLAGSTNPPYTAPLDFIAADFPFMDDAGGAVTHVATVTVAKLN
jgi:hypothetical protein